MTPSMNILGLAAMFAALVASQANAQATATPSQMGYLTTSGCYSGQTVCFTQYGATVPVSGSLTPVGTQDTNLKQVNGATVNVGVGAAGTGTQRVTTSTDSTIATITNPVGIKGADGSTIASSSNPAPVNQVSATKVSTAALAANLVVSAAPASLFSFEVSADSTLSAAAWWVMAYDATAAPADGAVTPIKCYALPSGAPSISAGFTTPETFSTGVVIGVSTTGCFTKTASTHAFISGGYR